MANVGTVNVTAEINQNLIDRLNAVYKERDMCVAGLARLAQDYGLNCGIGQHEPKPGEEWEEEWLNIVFIDLPVGQVSWHIHRDELPMFSFLGEYNRKWDGHDTEEKYRRVVQMFPEGPMLPANEGD